MRMMMILAALPLAACGAVASETSGDKAAPSGGGTTRSFAVADFSRVDLRGGDDVIVNVGSGYAVRAEGPSEELDRLEIQKVGDTLKVGRVRDSGFNWGGARKGAPVKVYVTMPRIAAGSVAGSGDLSIDRVAGGDFHGAIAGSGDLSIGAMQAGKVDFSIAGSGNVFAKGQAGQTRVSVAGSGDVDAKGLKASGAEISVAGSGNVALDVQGPAKVSLMGSGDVDVGANARCQANKMGSGTVRCG